MNRNFLKKIRYGALILILVLTGAFVGFRYGQKGYNYSSYSTAQKANLDLFWRVWSILELEYLDKNDLDREKMVMGAISGMVSSLGDPYTSFFPPDDNKINQENLTGEFGGVGIQLGFKNGILAVVSPLENTPAKAAGIRSGDLILQIRDKSKDIDIDTNNLSLPEAVKIIRGKEGTKVEFTIAREGEDRPLEIAVIRAKIVVPSVETSWIDYKNKKIAYIHLLQFSEVMYDEWKAWSAEVVAKKNNSNFGGVILDLRNNPGGYLQGAVFVASEFIDKGVIVEQLYSSGAKDVYRVTSPGKLLDVPLVVLINGGSASSSEILAGALSYYKRAVLIGETTFGKGTVQEPQTLPGGAGLHVTVSKWLLPGGKNIHDNGIDPDILVEESKEAEEDDILERAKEELVK